MIVLTYVFGSNVDNGGGICCSVGQSGGEPARDPWRDDNRLMPIVGLGLLISFA